jgi:hypothetical protein
MGSKLMKRLRVFSICYIVVLLCCVIASLSLGWFPLERGCYLKDALVIGAECRGFVGAEIISFVLNMPLLLFLGPLFGIAGLLEGPFILQPLCSLLIGVVLWSPIVFLGWFHVKKNT